MRGRQRRTWKHAVVGAIVNTGIAHVDIENVDLDIWMGEITNFETTQIRNGID